MSKEQLSSNPLVARLRDIAAAGIEFDCLLTEDSREQVRKTEALCSEAASEIERLQAELSTMEDVYDEACKHIPADEPKNALGQAEADLCEAIELAHGMGIDADTSLRRHMSNALASIRATVPPRVDEKVCDDKLEIIHEHGQPHGIRDRGGYLFFFPTVSKYQGQEERYRNELAERFRLADFLLEALKSTTVTKRAE